MSIKRLSLLFAAVLAGVAAAPAQPHTELRKLSPLVRQAVREAGRQRMKGVGDAGRGREVTAFVCADPAVAGGLFERHGCRVYDRSGDIFIVSMPLQSIGGMAAERAVTRIEASVPCRQTMDTTAIITGGRMAQAGEALPRAFTGSGVVVGVMDVGFDLTHPNFLDAASGQCRIGAFWDQLDRDTVGSSLPVGRDYAAGDIPSLKTHSADGHIQSHGTHTLGIAAGSGYDSPYRGMAFDSELCLVSNAVSSDLPLIDSADVYKYTSAVDALGFKYIFDYAGSRGKPCVISFSEGYHVGYDGEDSLFCEYLGRLTGPGRIIVTSAGNESLNAGYLPKPAGVAEAGSFVHSLGRTSVLYASADGPFTMRLISYGDNPGELVIPSHSCAADTTTVFSWPVPSAGQPLSIEIERYHSAFSAADTIYRIVITGDAPPSPARPVAMTVSGVETEVSVRAASAAVFVNGLADAAWSAAETSHNILAPGCFPGLITVGSTTHRMGYRNYLGEWVCHTPPGLEGGLHTAASSVGPGTGGIIKPEVVAPGDNVVSSYSSFYLEHNPDAIDIPCGVRHFEYGGRTYSWNSSSGTSMSAPVVAGAIALWLQVRPDLTPAEALDVIRETSRRPEPSMDYPNNIYGHGEINAHAGLLRLLGLSGIGSISREEPRGLSAGYSDGCLNIASAASSQCEVGVTVWTVGGAKVFSGAVTLSAGGTAAIPMPSLPAGVYAVQLSGEGGGSVLIRVR